MPPPCGQDALDVHRARAARRAGDLLDRRAELGAKAEREGHLGDDEERAYEETDEVVDERGLLALEDVTDELEDPTADEEAKAAAEPGAEAVRGERGAAPRREHGEEPHHRTEAPVEREVEEDDPGADDDGGRDGDPERLDEHRTREQRHDREEDCRDPDEVGGDVAPIPRW